MNKLIYTTLRDRIIYLEYAPGQILKEQALAEEFGVSRTPLRTVLFRLEWEHLVKILPRTGILVMELEMHTITHVFQARLELEAVIGTMAAERFTPQDLKALKTLCQDCSPLLDHKDPKALAAVDIATKTLFHRAADNPFLIEMSERLYSLTFRLWFFTMLKMDNQAWDQEVTAVKQDLADLAALVADGTPEETGQARKAQLITHLKRIRSRFLGLSDEI